MRRNLALSLLAAFVLALGFGIQQSVAADEAAAVEAADAKTLTFDAVKGLTRYPNCDGYHASFSGYCSGGWEDSQCASFCLSAYPENGGVHFCHDNSPCSPAGKCCMCME